MSRSAQRTYVEGFSRWKRIRVQLFREGEDYQCAVGCAGDEGRHGVVQLKGVVIRTRGRGGGKRVVRRVYDVLVRGEGERHRVVHAGQVAPGGRHVIDAVRDRVTVRVAVVPVITKSAGSTLSTASLKVTRQVRVSELVGDEVGSWRVIDVTVGAVVSVTVAVVALAVLEGALAPTELMAETR